MASTDDIEEGEIASSEDDDTKSTMDQKSVNLSTVSKAPAYSMFDVQTRLTPVTSFPYPPASDSGESSDSVDDDDDDGIDIQSKKKRHSTRGPSASEQSFVNPNFVKCGGVMPPLPRSQAKNVWSSVLQEQILTAEVSSFNMENKLTGDRDVESYDYTRAKDDDRPALAPEPVDVMSEEDIFGEVIDLEAAAFEKRRTLKRKHVAERLGKKKSVKDRLDLPKVSENSSVEEVTYYISTLLEESKVHLIRRVVSVIGKAKALEMYKQTEEVEAAGGMLTMNGQRRRTKGGVYLTLLKTKSDIPKEQLDVIFEEEQQKFLEKRKMRKKAKARKKAVKKALLAATIVQHGANNSTVSPCVEMQGEEESNSRSSIEGQRGSPRHPTDHLSDIQASPTSQDGASSAEDADDFDAQLFKEIKRQAESLDKQRTVCQQSVEVEKTLGGGHGITLDDVLDIGVDEDDID